LHEDLPVEKQPGTKRLVLSGSRDTLVPGEVGQEGGHLLGSHGARVPQVEVPDEALDPPDVGLLRPEAVVVAAHDIADVVKQARAQRQVTLLGDVGLAQFQLQSARERSRAELKRRAKWLSRKRNPRSGGITS
jgi:hypothetical protein